MSVALGCYRCFFSDPILRYFCERNVIVVVCKRWKRWSCVLIRNNYHVIFPMFVRYVAFVISKSGEPVWWNTVLIRNIYHMIFCVFVCCIIFLKIIVPDFLCPFFVSEVLFCFLNKYDESYVDILRVLSEISIWYWQWFVNSKR